MCNTSQESVPFANLVQQDPDHNPRMVVVNGAQGGQTASIIANPNANFWTVVDQRLAAAGLTPAQVQVVWYKEANASPTQPFPQHADSLRDQSERILRIIQSRYPNTVLCYGSSRIYAGYASSALNPEPYAYESGFAIKWLIEDQVSGAAGLNFDPAAGPVVAPWLSWGPRTGHGARGDPGRGGRMNPGP